MNNITVITSSRNREEFLEEVINHVAKINSLKEHLIIDFDSRKKIKKSDYKNKKVKIINVINEPEWSITRSYNSGIHLSNTDYIMKIDADVLIDYEKFNKINYEKYDILYFMENDWDPGNFISKASLLKEINGFNEYIKSRFDDNDMLKRIKNNGYNIEKVPGVIKEKINHSDELRHNTAASYFKNKDRNSHAYAVVKAHNNCGAYVSSLNIWGKNSKLCYKQHDNLDIEIKHPRYYEELKIIFKFKLKFIFLKTFFTIFFKNSKSLLISILKRILPLIFFLTPLKITEKIIGVKVSS